MTTENNSRYRLLHILTRQIPVGIILLLVFSLLSSVYAAFYLVFASEEHRDLVVPHVGWIGHFLYVYVLAMSVMLVTRPANKLRLGLVIVFVLLLTYGLYSLITMSNDQDYGNPYLTYGAFRPIWEIALPLFWIAVLSSKSVRKFCNNGI